MICLSNLYWQCVCWWVLWSEESGLCVFGKLCPVGFLVLCTWSSVLLQSIVMSYVDCGDDGLSSMVISVRVPESGVYVHISGED